MPTPYLIVAIGEQRVEGADAIGGDKRLPKFGYHFEVMEVNGADDGGPALLAVCPDIYTAQRIKAALLTCENN